MSVFLNSLHLHFEGFPPFNLSVVVRYLVFHLPAPADLYRGKVVLIAELFLAFGILHTLSIFLIQIFVTVTCLPDLLMVSFTAHFMNLK